jgi:hypothetical protein
MNLGDRRREIDNTKLMEKEGLRPGRDSKTEDRILSGI